MKFALIVGVAVCCLSAVFAGPFENSSQLPVPLRNPIMDNYCDIVVMFVDYIRGLPESLKPMGCFATSFIDRLCSTTFSSEFCMETFNFVEDEGDEDDDEGFGNDNDDINDDNETEISSPGTDVNDSNSVITTTPTPDDTEAHTISVDTRNLTEKSNMGTASKAGIKFKHSNKISKNDKGKSKESQPSKSKGKHTKNKNGHGKRKGNSKTKSKGHNEKKNKN